jgi:hypothetical protein
MLENQHMVPMQRPPRPDRRHQLFPETALRREVSIAVFSTGSAVDTERRRFTPRVDLQDKPRSSAVSLASRIGFLPRMTRRFLRDRYERPKNKRQD